MRMPITQPVTSSRCNSIINVNSGICFWVQRMAKHYSYIMYPHFAESLFCVLLYL